MLEVTTEAFLFEELEGAIWDFYGDRGFKS